MHAYLGTQEHFTRSEGRSNFIADLAFFVEGGAEDEEENGQRKDGAPRNMWSAMQRFLMMIPEVQNSFSSFRLRRELLTPQLMCQLFNAKKINRFCLDTIFKSEEVKFITVLQALGVSQALIPPGWCKMSLHSELRDEGNRNSNVFNLVNVGRGGCVLAVNMIALVLIAPLFQADQVNILHQLQQKHTTVKTIEFAMARSVPRAYWPSGPVPVVQLDHMGHWIHLRMANEARSGFTPTFFDRALDVEWHGLTPQIKGKFSPLHPFYGEESAVCGNMIGMVKRMADGIRLTDAPVTIQDYHQALVNLGGQDAPPCYVNLNEDLDNFYVFMTPRKDFVLVRFEVRSKRMDAHVHHLKLVEKEGGPSQVEPHRSWWIAAHSLPEALEELSAYPYPRVISERLVMVDGDAREYYEGLEDGRLVSNFGVVRRGPQGRWLDEEGYYSVEVKDGQSDDRFLVRVSVANVHMVLVGELQKMVLPFQYMPADDVFLPIGGDDEDGLVYVYNLPSDGVSLCVGMSCKSNGVYDVSLETMEISIDYACLLDLEVADSTEDVICDFVAYHEKRKKPRL
eukprot:600002-Hanusia_phi.AAC.4